ncbi:MAG: DUF1444 family protein [Burkholderiales bacterium]|nr:DUF1444 family protein [Phycisphaerae bacterium]
MPEVSREQFAQQVIDIVRSRFPLAKIARAPQSFSIRMNGRVASLENLYRVHQLAPEELRHQVERWAVELLRDAEGTPDRFAGFDEIKERLMPIVVASDLADLRQSNIVTQPVIEGLAVTYVLDSDRTFAYVPTEELSRWQKTVDELHEVAMANLIARSHAIQAHAAQDEDGSVNLVVFQTLDGYDASRILLPTLHDRLREYLGSPFACAVPNRDILLCFRSDEDTVSRLGAQVAQDYRTMPHQVTDKLFLVTQDGVAPLQAL